MKKVAVINPYVADFKLYDEWMHPLGLYFLMAGLINSGHNVYFFNCLTQDSKSSLKKYGTGFFGTREIEKPPLYNDINRKYKMYGCQEDDFKSFLMSIPCPDLFCIGSMMTYWAPGVIRTIQIIREIFPATPVVLGGIAAQLTPDYYSSKFDNCLIAGSLFELEKNVRSILDMDSISPDVSLIPSYSLLKSPPHGALLISLGCPLSCTYCASRTLQPQFRSRPYPVIASELEYLAEQQHITDFSFFDDALLYKPENVLYPLFDFVQNRGLKLRFHTPNGMHLNMIHEELLFKLLPSGFTTLRFGFESSAKEYKNDTCGKSNRRMVEEKVALIHKCSDRQLDIGFYIMAGLRNQSPDDVLEDMEFVNSLNVKVKPVFLSPVPGTQLFSFYASIYPSLKSDPLWHNDSFFITRLPGWNSDHIERIRLKARELNQKLISL